MFRIFDDSDSDVEIKTNNEYAKTYDHWRKKEELNKLETKYGEDLFNEESSSSEDDSDGAELTEEIEKQFFKTLSALKNKDPLIYDEKVKFFHNAQPKVSKGKKERPMYINDYERELIWKNSDELSDTDNEPIAKSPTYVNEQKRIKESLKEVLNNVDDEEDGDWGGMLKVRQKSQAEKDNEEAGYKEWLAGQKEQTDDKEAETELKPLKEYWSNPNLDDGEKFLRDYILQKKFLSKEDDNYIPTYEEIIHDSDKDFSEDENNIEQQEQFEHKYNFRFEEPDQEFVKRYPRTMDYSLRKTNDKRKLKRAEVKERKQQEKQEKMQELKKLQELKRKEIEEKIEKLKEITGNTDIAFKDEDLDGDFDPEAHDKRMQSMFNDEFYQGGESDQKPEFPELDEMLELENWDKWDGDNEGDQTTYENEKEYSSPHCEDEDFNMDADYDPQATTQELIENSKNKKKRKRKSLFAKVVSQSKQAFDPTDKTYEEYVDEYYKLDCEDIIGDIPCRFKYRKVVPNSFGLTIEEILTAKDRELNKWCSLKKAVQHRPDHVEKYDQIAFERKGKNLELKKKILPSLFELENESEETKEQNKKKKKKQHHNSNNSKSAGSTKMKNNKKDTAETNSGQIPIEKIKKNRNKTDNLNGEKKRKLSETCTNNSAPIKKKKKNFKSKNQDIGISDSRLSAYGLNPKKFKNKIKYKNP